MSIRQDIERELKRIQAVSGRGLLQVDVPEGRIEADLVAVDAIGCAFQTLAYSTSLLAESSLEDLKQVSHIEILESKAVGNCQEVRQTTASATRVVAENRRCPSPDLLSARLTGLQRFTRKKIPNKARATATLGPPEERPSPADVFQVTAHEHPCVEQAGSHKNPRDRRGERGQRSRG